MFPSTSNLGTNFFYSDNSNNSFDSTNPYNSSSFPIHSPYIFYEDDLQHHLHDFLQYQQQQQQAVLPIVAHQEINTVTNINMNQNHTHDIEHVSINGLVQGSPTVTDDVVFCSTKKQIPRKRTSNRDRHSKINTAHGPRDRRMRLSLDVAQKFFGLQDMLGFDKASKTVQWLLTKSRTAIKKLSSTTNNKGGINIPNTTSSSSTSNNSECEVLSGILDESAASFSLPGETAAKEKAKPAAAATREKKATPPSRGSRAFRPITKEAREKARARARERTEGKRSIRLGNVNYYDHQSKKIPCIVGIDQNLNQNSASWVPFEAAGEEESSTIQIGKEYPSFPHADHQEPTSRTTSLQHEQDINVNGGHSNLFTTEGNWNPSPAFNYHHNAAISHEDSFTEVQYFGKPWG